MNVINKVLSRADGKWDLDARHECHWWQVAVAAYGAYTSNRGARQSARGIKEQGRLAKERGLEQQTYNQVAATEAMAIGRMNASEDRRQARLIASRAVAVSAAGGSVSDIEHLIGDIYGEGAYRAAISLMDAQSQSSRLLFEGEQAAKYGIAQEASAQGAAKAQKMSGLGTLFKTGAALFGGFDFG